MRRPQFTLKTLLWLMAVVAAFLGGAAVQYNRANERARVNFEIIQGEVQKLTLGLSKEAAALDEENRQLKETIEAMERKYAETSTAK